MENSNIQPHTWESFLSNPVPEIAKYWLHCRSLRGSAFLTDVILPKGFSANVTVNVSILRHHYKTSSSIQHRAIPEPWWLHTFAVCTNCLKHYRHLRLVFLMLLKVVRKCKQYQWGERCRIFENHSCIRNQWDPKIELCKEKLFTETSSAMARGKLSWADRTAMTPVYHKSWILTKPSYGTELQTQCSIQVLAWSSQPASASVEAVPTSSPCCRREQDFQVVPHRIINHYEDFTHNPHCLCCDIWLICCLCE